MNTVAESEQNSSVDNFVIEGLVDERCEPLYEESGGKGLVNISPFQLNILETAFKKQNHVDEAAVDELARMTNLTHESVRSWLKNRRQKISKEKLLEPKWLRKLENNQTEPSPAALYPGTFYLPNNATDNSGAGQITVQIVENIDTKDEGVAEPGYKEVFVGTHGRVSFSKQQANLLESIFQKNNYPDIATRTEAALQLGLSLQKVKHWFQNRRAKKKKEKTSSQPEPALLPDNNVGLDAARKEGLSFNLQPRYSVPYNQELYTTVGVNIDDFITKYPIPRYIL